MFPKLLALCAFAAGAVAGLYGPDVFRRRWGGHAVGRFAADWIGVFCYMLGLTSILVLWDEGRWEYRGGVQRWNWTGAVSVAVATATIWAAIDGVRRWRQRGGAPADAPLPRELEFSPDYVRDILEAEQRAPAADCRKMARVLEQRARKLGEPLPPELRAFVDRYSGA